MKELVVSPMPIVKGQSFEIRLGESVPIGTGYLKVVFQRVSSGRESAIVIISDRPGRELEIREGRECAVSIGDKLRNLSLK